MDIETVLKNIGKYDFKKLSRCFDSPHSTTIGFWSHWWLSICKDCYVKDEALQIKTDDGETRADLMLYYNNGRLWGIVEVENNCEHYVTVVENLSCYAKKFDNLKFLIVHVWTEVDEKGNYKKTSEIRAIKDAIDRIKQYYFLQQYWIFVISKWGKDNSVSSVDFDGDYRTSSYVGFEWQVFKGGKKIMVS